MRWVFETRASIDLVLTAIARLHGERGRYRVTKRLDTHEVHVVRVSPRVQREGRFGFHVARVGPAIVVEGEGLEGSLERQIMGAVALKIRAKSWSKYSGASEWKRQAGAKRPDAANQ